MRLYLRASPARTLTLNLRCPEAKLEALVEFCTTDQQFWKGRFLSQEASNFFSTTHHKNCMYWTPGALLIVSAWFYTTLSSQRKPLMSVLRQTKRSTASKLQNSAASPSRRSQISWKPNFAFWRTSLPMEKQKSEVSPLLWTWRFCQSSASSMIRLSRYRVRFQMRNSWSFWINCRCPKYVSILEINSNGSPWSSSRAGFLPGHSEGDQITPWESRDPSRQWPRREMPGVTPPPFQMKLLNLFKNKKLKNFTSLFHLLNEKNRLNSWSIKSFKEWYLPRFNFTFFQQHKKLPFYLLYFLSAQVIYYLDRSLSRLSVYSVSRKRLG